MIWTAFLYQVKKTPCYDVNGYEFYPVRNYDMNSDDWIWVPEEFESAFQEKGHSYNRRFLLKAL